MVRIRHCMGYEHVHIGPILSYRQHAGNSDRSSVCIFLYDFKGVLSIRVIICLHIQPKSIIPNDR